MVSIFSFVHADLAELHNTPVRLYQVLSFSEFWGKTFEMDGDSWDESFKTIKQALERAIASDEISARGGELCGKSYRKSLFEAPEA